MRKYLFFLSFVFIARLQVSAQRELLNPLIDSKVVIAKGDELHAAGKYKEAIVEYSKVPESDTAYSDALHDIISSYYNDSNYVAAEKYLNIAFERYPDKCNEWYGMLADVYDDTKRVDLALKAYDTILARNPYSYTTYFNKGITLYRQLRFDEAAVNFQSCIMLNPYYSAAHYFLAQIAMSKGNMVEAMLSFTTSLLVSPGNRYLNNTVNYLVTISEVNTTAKEYLQKYKRGKQDNFEDVQEILVSKIALDKKYKLKVDLEDQIVRQLQVVMEKLEFNTGDKGFWMQFYVPLFKSLWDKGQIEPMVFYMFSELEIKKAKEYVKKEKKKIENLSNITSGYLNNLRESHELLYDKRANTTVKYYIKNYQVNGKGVFSKNAKNEDIVTGPWEFYYTNGQLMSKGVFNNEGNRQGEWTFYYDNGIKKEISNYNNDLVNGKTIAWYDNGVTSNITHYVNDKMEGEETVYFYSGKLLSLINYKGGKKNGVAKYYNQDGYLRTLENYLDDKLEDEEIVYHSNGNISYRVSYVKDKATGEYKELFDNGKMKMSGIYTDGKKEGIWTTYYKNGKTKSVENYLKGELDGEVISYHENGKIESKIIYKKGDLEGKKEAFDDDGIVYNETIFENDRLRDIKFFDKKGNIISSTTSRKGDAIVAFYTPDGAKESEGYYSKDGLAEGNFKYYYKNGQLSAEGSYKNGLQEGKKTYYYSNGKISQSANYKADKADGYFINYYINGQVSGEGWYVNDERQGTFINYDLLGNINSKTYYINGKVHGITEYYTPTGKIDYKQFYDFGWMNKTVQFDTLGKIMVSSPLTKGEGQVLFNHYNGKPYSLSNYKYYNLNGVSSITNGDGTKRILNYYKNGVLDSNYTAWYPNGKLQLEGKYINGDKAGEWKYYYYNGQVSDIEHYVDGELEGLDTQLDELGEKDKVTMYKGGKLNGESRYYGDNGQLILVFYNKENEIEGYSYEDKNGKLLPMIQLAKGNGVVDTYYKNGTKSAHMEFSAGVVIGDRLMYYSNGKEMVVGARVNGYEHGSKKIYYVSGKIMKEENYYYGEKHGLFKYYNENGSLISELNYNLGTLDGICKYYTAGKLTQTYTYIDGLLDSKK
ncbi:hypothetical protein BH11BAC3_BH11BAC3_24720 [soil metagenome]